MEIHNRLDPWTVPPFVQGRKREFTQMKDNRDPVWLWARATSRAGQ